MPMRYDDVNLERSQRVTLYKHLILNFLLTISATALILNPLERACQEYTIHELKKNY